MNEVDARPLVQGPAPVKMGDRGDSARPGTALVFSLSDGTAVAVDRRPRPLAAKKYRFRYEVDTGDHLMSWHETLPSSVGGYGFQAEVHAGWRVTDPAEIVKRRIATEEDGNSLARRGLLVSLRDHTQKFDIVATGQAEAALNMAFGDRDVPLSSGITVFDFSVHVSLDQAAEDYLRRREGLEWEKDLTKRKHGLDVTTAEQGHVIEIMQESHESLLVAARAERLRQASRGDGGLIVHLIAQDPSQMRSILQEMGSRHDLDMQRKWGIFQELADKGFIQPADLEPMWDSLVQKPRGFAAGALMGSGSVELTSLTAATTVVRPDPGSQDDDMDVLEEHDGVPDAPPADGLVGWTSVKRRGQNPPDAGGFPS
jgi:hypothetical protein